MAESEKPSTEVIGPVSGSSSGHVLHRSDALTRAILESSLDCIIILDEEGRILEFNPAAERAFGRVRAEVLGQEMALLIVPERHRDSLNHWSALGHRSLHGKRVEIEALHASGREFPVELALVSVGESGARITTAYLRDISERKRAERVANLMSEASKLLASSFDNQTTLHHVAHLAVPTLADWCAIEISESEGQPRQLVVAHWDPAKERMARELEGRWPPDPDSPRGAPNVLRTGISEMVTEIPQQALIAAAQDAEHMEVLMALQLHSYIITPLRAGGRVVGTFTMLSAESKRTYGPADLEIAEELSRRASVAIDNARLFQERDELIRALQRSNSELNQFAYVASHDLKAPLRGIANLSQWIEEDMGDAITDGVREQLRLMRGRVHRLEALINGVLSYSRAGSSEKLESVDVAKLLAETIELLAAPAATRIRVKPGMPLLQTERIPLQQIFLNLIGNAIKYGGRADVEIDVEVADAGPLWEFKIADNGPGIEPQYQERVWHMFQTLEPRDKIESTGIGLAVVKKIVERKGGAVRIESTGDGTGAAFFFSWPKRERGMGGG